MLKDIDEEECDDRCQGAGSSEKEMHQNSHLDSYLRVKTDLSIELPRLEAKETIDDIRINPDLSPEQQEQLKCLVRNILTY